jgi:arylsulfatase A-like enzyme
VITVLETTAHGLVKVPVGPATPAIEHRPYGIIALHGPGIKKGEQIFGSSLVDIMPTLLQLFDLPVAADMPGQVLYNAFEKTPKVQQTKLGKVQGNDAMLSPNAASNAEAEQAALNS